MFEILGCPVSPASAPMRKEVLSGKWLGELRVVSLDIGGELCASVRRRLMVLSSSGSCLFGLWFYSSVLRRGLAVVYGLWRLQIQLLHLGFLFTATILFHPLIKATAFKAG
ncbi:hypothetical protein Bca101_081427 [Brassica carinata]